MPGQSLAGEVDSCRAPVCRRETLADGKVGAVRAKGEQTGLIRGHVGEYEIKKA